MMTKHTPGPWTIGSEGYNACVVYAADGLGVCQVFGLPLNTKVASVGPMWAEGLQTARLISAAPDMYEALKDLVTSLNVLRVDGLEQELVLARAALSKAEGAP